MAHRAHGRLRIIGGKWRSRLIDFAQNPDVRPTPDRVRQTLFDWLAPRIDGARCLDLFAGSGALGLEALSRGAASVRFVERGVLQVKAISEALRRLDAAHQGETVQGDAVRDVQNLAASRNFNIVFLDPPYDAHLLELVLPLLPPLLNAEENRVYLEWSAEQKPELPAGFSWLREKKAGRVSFGLITYESGDSE